MGKAKETLAKAAEEEKIENEKKAVVQEKNTESAPKQVTQTEVKAEEKESAADDDAEQKEDDKDTEITKEVSGTKDTGTKVTQTDASVVALAKPHVKTEVTASVPIPSETMTEEKITAVGTEEDREDDVRLP